MEPVVLRTARLELSPPRKSDVEAIFRACQDAAIQRYTTVPSPYERQHAEGFIPVVAQGWEAGTEAVWAMRESGALAGMVGLHGLTGNGIGELGYWVAPWSRRRGLLVEAANAVLDWGFSPAGTGLTRIQWNAVVGNTGSARAARALGFRYEGLRRQALANAHHRDDGWVAGLLATDDRMPQHWAVLEG